MGLAERRAQQSFAEGKFKEFSQEIEKIVGKSIDVDVDWSSIALDDYSHMYEESWSKLYFRTLTKALEKITIDDMGKQALSESLNKVKIQNTDSNSSERNMATFEDGTLTLDHKPFSNVPDPDYGNGEGDGRFQDRVKAIVGVLEKNL